MVYLGPINPHTVGMLHESQLKIEGFTPYGIDLIRENEKITQYAVPFPKSREPDYEPVEPLISREPNNSLFNYQAPESFVSFEPVEPLRSYTKDYILNYRESIAEEWRRREEEGREERMKNLKNLIDLNFERKISYRKKLNGFDDDD